MAFTVAIVGRPNVGKSTLFNRLVGRRRALVHDAPGLTRDRREGTARLGDLSFTVVDTAGFEDAAPATLAGRMRVQTELAVRGADLVLLVIDARAGVTGFDRQFANHLRRSGRPIILVANKCESRAADAGAAEAHGLGFGEPVRISAEHNEGFGDLYHAIRTLAPPVEPAAERDAPDVADEAAERPLRLAVVGRPNVGKSTLVNRLLGEERMLTGPEPGITRDAIETPWRWRDRPVVLVDTAGLRKKARVEETPEALAGGDTGRAIAAAQVVVLVLDATVMLERQDLIIANLAIEEGRALVIAANKWDLVEEPQAALRRLRDRIETSLPQVRGVRFVCVSGLAGTRLDELMKEVFEAARVWSSDLPTAQVNRWIERTVETHPPPLVKGRRPRIMFARQVATRPPTIALFGRNLATLPGDYLRYLENSLREAFELPGTPIRWRRRSSENPFVDQ